MIMKKISHPNIVNLLDVHITKHSIYLIMDLIRGEELYDKIGKSFLRTTETRVVTVHMTCST
jgi:serine/threonine protein kinase